MLLYDKTHDRRDEFNFNINGGGDLCVQEHGTVKIEFINKVFCRASYPMHGSYTRNGWRILAAIEAQIAELEVEMMDKKEG
jgi:hypothetical protein